MKKCIKCGDVKDECEFRVYKQYNKLYTKTVCKKCETKNTKKWRRNNIDKYREINRRRANRIKNTPKEKARDSRRGKIYRSKNPDKVLYNNVVHSISNQTGLPVNVVKEYKDLIESNVLYRKVKRILKQNNQL